MEYTFELEELEKMIAEKTQEHERMQREVEDAKASYEKLLERYGQLRGMVETYSVTL